MRKKLLKLMIYLGLAMMFFNILIREESENKHRGSSVVRIGEETVHVFLEGMDITGEYQRIEQKAKESVARYFNKECSEIRFYNYCMLEMDGMTIDAVIENREYTILLNIEGEIISVKNIPRETAVGYSYEGHMLIYEEIISFKRSRVRRFRI